MTRAIRYASVDIFEPDNDSFTDPDMTIPEEDIAVIECSSRINEEKDTARMEFHNNWGQYSNNADIDIRSGQRVQFNVGLEDDIEEWGEGSWGLGAWSGERIRWTGLVRDVNHLYGGPNASILEISAEDFVSGILSKRNHYSAYINDPIAGDEDAILNDAITDETDEIDTSFIDDFTDQETSIASDGTDLMEFSSELALRAEDAIMYTDRDRLRFEHIGDKSPKFEVEGDEIGYFDLEVDDSNLANSIRIDGSEEREIDDEQLDKTDYTTVTDENRLTFQISTRKSSIEAIDIWTRRGANENITVRLQKDDGGQPIDVDDRTSDIKSRTLSHEFISEDDFTEFIIPDHILPEPNPWIIIQTDGDEGHDIGVDSEGTPAYKAWYSYTITVRRNDRDSINTYRERHHRIKDDSVTGFEVARDVAEQHLDHYSVPEKKVTIPAESERMHKLQVADVIELNFPREKAVGEFIVSNKSDSYEGNKLQTTIEAIEVESI